MRNTDITADVAAVLGTSYQVTTNKRGWIDIRVNPANAIGDPTKFDFLRIAQDDNVYRLIHLSHNEVIKGEANFSNSMTGFLPALVLEFCESTF